MLDELSQFLTKEHLTVRELADKWGVHHSQIVLLSQGKRPFRPLHRYALRALKEELRAQGRVDESAPACPRCSRPMRKSSKASHWYHRKLQECWTCSLRCHVMMGVPQHGPKARKLIRLDRAKNPNTGEDVHIPWRHKMSAYERRHESVWCDGRSGHHDGCGDLMTYGRTTKYKTSRTTYAVFKCNNRDCKYYKRGVYCRAGKAGPKPRYERSRIPAKAQTCPHCSGRVSRRMGKSYAQMNPVRSSRSELLRCHCTKCGKTLYFNLRHGKFEEKLRIGGLPVVDPHRPHCRRCARMMPGKAAVRRFALRAKVFRKRPTLAPIPVRLHLEGIKTPDNEDIAVQYLCRHTETWKTPQGKEIWQARRGPKWWHGHSYEQYKKDPRVRGPESPGSRRQRREKI